MTMRITQRLLTILLSIFLYAHFFSQTQSVKFKRLTINDGLSQSTINCILQDFNGYIWIGTQDGLNKYDGYNVTQYKHLLNNENSLSNSYITALFEDKKGGIWIGTQEGGLNYKNSDNDEFSHVKLEERLKTAHVTAIIQGQNNTLWIGTAEAGLISYDLGSKVVEVFNTENEHFLSNKVSDLEFINSELIVSTDKGLCRLDVKQRIFKPTEGWNIRLNDLGTHCLYKLNENVLIIGTNKGLNVLENKKISNLSTHLNEHAVMSVYADDLSNIWVGTFEDGLINCKKINNKHICYEYINNDFDISTLSNNGVNNIYKDVTGSIWAGTQDGLSYFDPLKQSFSHYTSVFGSKNSLLDKNVWGIHEQGDSVIWVGTRKGITRISLAQRCHW